MPQSTASGTTFPHVPTLMWLFRRGSAAVSLYLLTQDPRPILCGSARFLVQRAGYPLLPQSVPHVVTVAAHSLVYSSSQPCSTSYAFRSPELNCCRISWQWDGVVEDSWKSSPRTPSTLCTIVLLHTRLFLSRHTRQHAHQLCWG